MPNKHIFERLSGIQQQLIGLHRGGATLSSATKGGEREDLINKYLGGIMPPPYRFGDGDITDNNGERSGQVEIVVEYPFLPSLPMVGGSSRLYLAEGVAAVIEVKSSIDSQWDDVKKTAVAVKKLKRDFGATFAMGGTPQEKIPFFAVGYTGWKEVETVKSKLSDDVDGILIIDSGIFVSNQAFGEIIAPGPWALWGLIQCIHSAASTLKAATANPLDYALGIKN